MSFHTLKQQIIEKSTLEFVEASEQLEALIFSCSQEDLLDLVKEIGTIPEEIGHDSTEEKLYTKVSDIVFAKALDEIGYTVRVLRERADCADIVAQSKYHNYSFVGDAKAFRLSRTEKNAKDFKVKSMVHWRGDCDYSVLACPFFQYPKSSSQIYKEALEGNVSLFSWELLYILLKEGVVETPDRCLKDLWNQSALIASRTLVDKAKINFLGTQNENIRKILKVSEKTFEGYFSEIKKSLINRGGEEIKFYEFEIDRVNGLSREAAIEELLLSMKLHGKIETIKTFVKQLEK